MPNKSDQELEVKYYISDLRSLESRLQSVGARLAQARIYESNLRFDTPGGDLASAFSVLRLRQDTAARLTFKGPSRTEGGVRARQEIEFVVEDFNAARSLLEALGYQVSMGYEKYRTTYEVKGVLVTLDEMPYGGFAEIEGPDPEGIQAVNQLLGLNWEARILDSYTVLFERLKIRLGLTFRDLSFDNFQGLTIRADDFEVTPADL